MGRGCYEIPNNIRSGIRWQYTSITHFFSRALPPSGQSPWLQHKSRCWPLYLLISILSRMFSPLFLFSASTENIEIPEEHVQTEIGNAFIQMNWINLHITTLWTIWHNPLIFNPISTTLRVCPTTVISLYFYPSKKHVLEVDVSSLLAVMRCSVITTSEVD